jgi:anti-sigma regulatory factor (Ser/Thr protein kinase)
VHQYLQMHNLVGIVAKVPLPVRPTSTSPEVCDMSQGHHRTPVRTAIGPCVQEPPLPSLAEDTWLEALPTATTGRACQIASCPLDPGATASGAARDFTRQILGSWGLLMLAEDAAVIVSELVTNALCHGIRATDGTVRCGPVHDRVELILVRRPGEMVCAVTDPGAGHPVMSAPDLCAEAGRGLHVIEALAATWGWTRLDACKKAVWATLSLECLDGGRPRLSGPGGRVSHPVDRRPGGRRRLACCAGARSSRACSPASTCVMYGCIGSEPIS